jgi:hypothetical protein
MLPKPPKRSDILLSKYAKGAILATRNAKGLTPDTEEAFAEYIIEFKTRRRLVYE